MKKLIYLPLLLLTLVVGVNKVKADTTVNYTVFYDNFTTSVNLYNTYSDVIETMEDYWQENWASICPYYTIEWNAVYNPTNGYALSLICLNGVNYSAPYQADNIVRNRSFIQYNNQNLGILYKPWDDTYDYDYLYSNSSLLQRAGNETNGLSILKANFTPVFTSTQYIDTVILPSYTDNDYNFPSYTITNNKLLPTVETLVNGTYFPETSLNYTTINLHDYDYIILSLKNYNQEPFSTSIYTLGRLCLTPVYDYGMKEKSQYGLGNTTQGCSVNYDTSTPVNVYVLLSDLQNHGVWYIKAYDNSTNIIQVNSDIFDITYITSQNINDPQVEINGRSYPTIPFNSLSTTANKSTAEGYISGQVCAIGDLNCQASASGMDISDLFTHPLKLLQSIWTSITSVFTIITTFITILPPMLQTFLYVSFMLGIVIGIIKILL